MPGKLGDRCRNEARRGKKPRKRDSGGGEKGLRKQKIWGMGKQRPEMGEGGNKEEKTGKGEGLKLQAFCPLKGEDSVEWTKATETNLVGPWSKK